MNISAVTTSSAAELLGVNQSRVRAMIETGVLDATKVGRQWLVDKVSLERLAGSRNPTGATFSPRNAWGILFLASDSETPWLSSSELSRARHRLKVDSLLTIAPRLRSRAKAYSYHCHPSDLERIASEDGVILSGVSEAAKNGIDLVASDLVEGYVRENELNLLIWKYHLEPSNNPNLLLRTPKDLWPFPENNHFAPKAVVAIDLFESKDARSRRVGGMTLEIMSHR